jgi:hypothetical protein
VGPRSIGLARAGTSARSHVSRLALLTALAVSACGGGTPAATPSQAAAPPTTTASRAPAPPTSTPTEAPTSAASEPGPTTAPASPTADPYAFAALFEGTYRGSWTNITAGSSGPATMEIALDRSLGALVIRLDLGGNVFGGGNPAPEVITAPISLGTGLSFTSRTFGKTTVSVDFTGASPVITVSAPNVPSDQVRSFTATAAIADPSTIRLGYKVTFRTGFPDAKGTATLTRG